MGKIILNEIDYSGGNANVIRLTQAEYDALPPTKLTDNNVYMITDANGDGSQFQPVIYSEDEREIGVWTDGKPLYQKTVYYVGGTTGTISIAHNITNLGHCVSAIGSAYDIGYLDGSQRTDIGDVPFPRIAADGYNIGIIKVNTTNIMVVVPSIFNDRITDIYITLQYTKITDTAGSGTWTPQGVPAVHYNTDEQVVGTWIDGSTIYERTITFTNITIPKTGVKIGEIEIGDNIIEAQGHVIENGGMVYGIPELDLRWYVNNTDVLLLCYYASSWTIDSGDLTIKYTKTSQGGN